MSAIRLSTTTYDWVIAGLVGAVVGAVCVISPLLGLGLVITTSILLLILSRPFVLGFILVAAIVFTSGMTRGQILPLLIPNEAVLILSVALGVPAILLRQQRPKLPGAILAGIAFLVLGTAIFPVLTYLQRGITLSTSDLLGIVAPIQYLFLFGLILYLVSDNLERQRLIQWMFLCASFVAIVGILQAFDIGSISGFLQQWYPSKQLEQVTAGNVTRVTSVMGAWNSLGTFMMINLLLIIPLRNRTTNRLFQLNMLITAILCTACLLATSSWAALAGLIVGAFLMMGIRRRGLGGVVILLTVLAGAAIVFQPLIQERLDYQFGSSNSLIPQTLAFRFKLWRDVYLPVIEKNLVTGVRPNFAGLSFAYAENQYLYLLYRTGILSLIGHVTWVGLTCSWLYRKIRRSSGLIYDLSVTTLILFVLLTVMGMTNPVFTYSGSIENLWILLALVISSERGVALSTVKS